MSRHLRRHLLCVLLAVAFGAVGLWSVVNGMRAAAAVPALGVPVLMVAAARAGRSHRLLLASHRRARRAALGDARPVAPARPCCSFWRAPAGAAHEPDCARVSRPAPRRTSGTTRAWQELYEACCLRGWESRGSVHDVRLCARRAAA